MDSQQMTPQESLNLITEVINKAKQRQEENGVIYIYWGAIISLVSLAHFILQQMEKYELIFVPYLFIPLAVIISFFIFPYYKKGSPKNQIGAIVGGIWQFAAVNMMLLGFALADKLGAALIPMILVVEGIALGLSGIAVKSRILLFAGILANAAGIAGFWVPYTYQPLLAMGVGICSVIIPGILLNNAYRKRKHV